MQANGETPTDEFPTPPKGPVVDIAAAPLILIGVAGESESAYFKDEGIVRTFTKFQVGSVERGDVAPGSEITISALGGSTPELIQFSEHQPVFVKGEKSRLFLTPNEKIEGVYRVFGLGQGKQDTGTDGDQAIASGPFKIAGHICGTGFCLNHLSFSFERLPTGYKINPNTADIPGTAQELAAVQAGFNAWEEQLSRMDFHFNGTTTQQSIGQNGLSLVFWHDATGENCGGVTNYLACWHPFLDPVTFQYVEFDVDFNDAFEWTLTEGDTDVQSTAVHEAGHALGLDHVLGDCAQVMGIVDEDTGCGDQRALGQGDLNGVRTLYPGNTWYLRNSNNSGPPSVMPFAFGSSSDTPLAGDWDGDGDSTAGLFRAPNSWFLDNGFDGIADVSFNYGISGDTPVVGDWDGDGDATPGVKRGNVWHLSHDSDDPVAADISLTWGSSSDVFMGGNWDGVGGDTPGIFRPSTRQWFLNNNFDAVIGSGDVPAFIYGIAGDTPVVGDWDHVDKCPSPLTECFDDTPGVWRVPNSWFLNNGFDGVSEVNFTYGRRGNKLAGDWNNDQIDTIGAR